MIWAISFLAFLLRELGPLKLFMLVVLGGVLIEIVEAIG